MLFYEGLSCPVCKKRFEDGEDLVVCPHCGLPHHRACWVTTGQCAVQDKHDTPEQWSREKAQAEATKGHVPPDGEPKNSQICPHCYTRNAEFAEFCNHCGRHLRSTDWHSAPDAAQPPVGEYTPFQSNHFEAESYSAAERIGDFSASDLAAVVGNGARYYIPRFHRSEQTGSGGWNWAAFWLGPFWLLYRKQYATGIALFIMQTILNLATVILYLPAYTASTEQAMYEAMDQMMNDPFFVPIAVLMILLFIIRILLGTRGNDLYKLHCEKKIRAARQKTPDLSSAELLSVGGTSIGAAILFYMLSTLISNVFTYFLMM